MEGGFSIADAAPGTEPVPIPRAPGWLPWLGHSPRLLSKPLEFMLSLQKIGALVRVDIGTVPVVVVTDPELTRQVLNDSRTFDKGGPLFDKVRDLTGESLLTSAYNVHKRQRALMQPAFTRQRIKHYTAIMSEEIEAVLGRWQDGATIDVTEDVYNITARVGARTMFAAEIARPAVARIVAALSIYLKELFIRVMAPSGFFNVLPMPGNFRYRRAFRILHEAIDEIIASYHASGVSHGDLLSMLIAGKDDDGVALTDQEIHNEVITLFLAGIETTGSTLSWTLYLLGQHPEVAAQVNAEVDSVLGGRGAEWEDLSRLVVTDRVITESLRIYPPGWFFTRTTTKPVMLGPHWLPEGTGLVYSPYLLHRSAGGFDKPDHFDPDRWLPERSGDLPKSAFIPFGGGVHKCIGDRFGLTEVTLAVTMIASRWSLHPAGTRPVKPAARRATLTPDRLLMRIQKRN
jgi:cytochrome P450